MQLVALGVAILTLGGSVTLIWRLLGLLVEAEV
jgi:hypothetical protein